MANRSNDPAQLTFLDSSGHTSESVTTLPENWPPNEHFPLNLRHLKRTVQEEIIKGVSASSAFLIVTGFTSLNHLIDFFGEAVDFQQVKQVRVVLGWEPQRKGRKHYRQADLTKEVKDYYLSQDVSPLSCGSIIKLIELVKDDVVRFKFMDRLHAKLYVGDTHAILGSANFSKQGITIQKEANIRVSLAEDEQQYLGVQKIAENFYAEARDYKEEILELLQALLQIVNWDEALARAIMEIVDRPWYQDIPELEERLKQVQLWPSQSSGLSKALSILHNQGCVLIADPTGSGKTKLIKTLQLIHYHWLLDAGRSGKALMLTVCPPLVMANWQHEGLKLQLAEFDPLSTGMLSSSGSSSAKRRAVEEKIKMARVLTIDEAHHFIPRFSKRSALMSSHIADSIILATATPINKKSRDLLRLIEMLGIDNLADSEIETYKNLVGPVAFRKRLNLGELKTYIQQFLVRRTKPQLRRMIEREPELYTNEKGKKCRYPEPVCRTYDTMETLEDQQRAQRINELAGHLKGIICLQRIFKPDYEGEFDEAAYLERRLESAKQLAIYQLQARLRSSHVALVEHLQGTEEAENWFKFKTHKKHSGEIIQKIGRMMHRLPKTDFAAEVLKDWLTVPELYQKACEEEITVYQQITTIAKQMTGMREEGKAKQLRALLKHHTLLLAFDSTVITLDYLHQTYLTDLGYECYVITGDRPKEKVLEDFALGSKKKNVIALCSDSVAEGVNLQQASAVILLDMPSVMRLAEQRIGRIDRLDSPHQQIEVWWPNDSTPFKLRSDMKLVNTFNDAEELIGTNFELPADYKIREIQTQEMIEAFTEREQQDEAWEGIQDTFQPVHDLYEGENALISTDTFEYYRGVEASVKVRLKVGLVKSSSGEWLFLALRGSRQHPPKWYFIDEAGAVQSALPVICAELRKRLPPEQEEERGWDKDARHSLERGLTRLHQLRRELLPNKRKRALDVAEANLLAQLKHEKLPERKNLLRNLLTLFKPTPIGEETEVDLFAFSLMWLDILNPYLNELKRKSPRKVITLSDLKPAKKKLPVVFEYEALQRLYANAPFVEGRLEGVAACIVGVKV